MDSVDYTQWIVRAAGATFYLKGLYLRLDDSKQAARAEKAGQAVQEQLQRIASDASVRLQKSVDRFLEIEKLEGDLSSERHAWMEAIHGLLAIAIWAGVADSLQERVTKSPAGKKATQAIEVAMKAAKTAFPEEVRKDLVQVIAPHAIEESLNGLEQLLKTQPEDTSALREILRKRVKNSVDTFLIPWLN
jgi:hypothetical protein